MRQVQRLATLVGDLSEPLTQVLVQITGYKHVERLEVVIGRTALALELIVHLDNGITARPEQLFSEGVQDLIAILFFMEIAAAAADRGQARVLILDDVIQSVDSSIRVRLLEFIAESFDDWQAPDHLPRQVWREQVRSVLRRAGHQFVEADIRSWKLVVAL